MADPERAVFFDGQYITADDLTIVVDHDQEHVARHSRLLHDWGIADGLTLDKKTSGGSPYVEVQKGMAVDGTGREVIVPLATRLSESLFKQINGASTQAGAWYPVFLRGKDGPAAQAAATPAACGANGQPTRVDETFEITFGHIGDASLEQPAPDVTAGPGPYGQTLWNILLGFVQWDGQHFTDTSDTADGVSRQYAGVRAASVAAAGGGTLELRPDLTRQAGNIGLALGGTPPVLKFGVYKTDGTIDPQVTIDAAGNVDAKGTVSGKLQAGQPVVQSGIATNGMILQLPVGITQAQVDSGQAVLHIHVTPHDPGPSAPTGHPIGPVIQQCHVDSARRVGCVLSWFDHSGGEKSLPAPVDYLLIATAG
jgi:hypothetical protein